MRWTLLIVDDHAGFRTVARALLDVQLPDRDGFEVAELMARSPCAPRVLLTSSRSLGDVVPVRCVRTAIGEQAHPVNGLPGRAHAIQHRRRTGRGQ